MSCVTILASSSSGGRARPGSDGGAAALEWVGSITVAAVLIGAVLSSLALTGGAVQSGARSAICRVLTLGRGACAQAAGPAVTAAPSEVCSVPVGSPPGRLPVTRARLSTPDGRVWEKRLTTGGAYRVSRSAGDQDGAGSGPLVVDAADGPVTLSRDSDGELGLVAGQAWHTPSSAEADGLVSAATATRTEDTVLGNTPARAAWDGLRSVLGSGTEPTGTPDETVVGAGVVVAAADAATGVSSYASGSLGGTRALGVRVSSEGRPTVYLATEGDSGTDLVSAVSVDSTGAPVAVGVTVLLSRGDASSVADVPRISKAFAWDGTGDGLEDPAALSARVTLDDSAGGQSLSAASALLGAVGVQQWALGPQTGDPVTAFARTARTEGTVSARVSERTVDEPATGLQPRPGGVPMEWDTVEKGPGSGIGFDGRAWAPSGPCG